MKSDPKAARSAFEEGDVHGDSGDYGKALECFERALQLDPTFVMAWVYRAQALKDLGRLDESIAASEQALERAPKNVQAWKNKAKALKKLGRPEEARAAFKRAAELLQAANPDNPTEPPRPRETISTLPVAKTGATLIIHGHAKFEYELKSFLQNDLGLPEPTIMGDRLTLGKALPEKFEDLAGQVEFAIALLTPDDEGKVASSEASYQPRARQNVLIEIGWFWGRLGLGHVLLLVKDKVEIPSDLQGLEYYEFSRSPKECSMKIRDFYKAHQVSMS